MAKTIIEFEDTEKDVATLAINVVSFWSDVDDVRDKLRDHIKYGNPTTLEEIYRDICEIMEKYPLQ